MKMKMKTLNRFKAKAYSIFADDLHSALLEDERLKFERLRQIDTADKNVPLLNYAPPKEAGISTYRSLHDGQGYSKNNWAFDLAREPEVVDGKSFFEFGAGNGAFLEFLRSKGKVVGGVDLINPRNLKEIITGDFKLAFDSDLWRNADVCYSADFLEHLELRELERLFNAWAVPGKLHIHLIACYDDNISHETVMPPHLWALLLSRYFKQVEIRSAYYRRYPGKKEAAVLVFQL